MRKRKTLVFSVIFLILVVGGPLVAVARGPTQRYSTTLRDIRHRGSIGPIDGSQAQLVTDGRGASLQVQTSGLTPGHAVTLWWMIFNYPENCSDGVCGVDDAFPSPGNKAAGASVSFAAGQVIGSDGRANFDTHISAGGNAAPWAVGLLSPRTAEYHFVLRDHGAAVPGLVTKQILAVGGGGCTQCPPEVGESYCIDVQAGWFAK